MFKYLSLSLNIILIIAVGFLYYQHFKPAPGAEKIVVPQKELKPSQIVFINSDSLLNRYELYQKLKKELEDKNRRSELDLESKGKAFEQEVKSYQQKAATLTQEQMAVAEEGLKRKQQEILAHREELGQHLSEEEKKLTEQLYSNISEFLKRYSKSGHYKYVLGYSKGGGILYANDSLDITHSVLEGLNREYREKSK